jgi:uncharacterized membrane protein
MDILPRRVDFGACGLSTLGQSVDNPPLMYEIVKLLHLIAGIVWLGGMTFMLVALRPAVMAQMEPQARARLMAMVWGRFFPVVLGAIVVLFTTGTNLYTTTFRSIKAATGAGSVPMGWNLMLVAGLAMMLIFGHIFFAGYRKFKGALARDDWAVVAAASTQVHRLMVVNFALGWFAVIAVRLVG